MTAATPTIRISPSKVFAPCNLPFLLLFVAHVLYSVNRATSGQLNPPEWSAETNTKYALAALLAAGVIWKAKDITDNISVYLWCLLLLFGWNIVFNTYDMAASFNAMARYLIPLLFLLYGLVYRDKVDELASAVFALAIANNLVQCVAYVFYVSDIAFLPVDVLTGALPRATGLAGICGYSLVNYACAVISFFCLEERVRLRSCLFFFVFGLASFSFKAMPSYGLLGLLMLRLRNRAAIASVAVVVMCVAVLAWVEIRTGSLSREIVSRYYAYGVDDTSARRDSYRVMFESLGGGNVLGEGLGCFGGPVSTKYNSPTYQKYDFSWGECISMTTTDTYFPHVFVELGLVGGLLYLGMFALPAMQGARRDRSVFLLPYFALCFGLFVEGIASFSVQSFDSIVISSLLFGLYHRGQRAVRVTTRLNSFANTAICGPLGTARRLQSRPLQRQAAYRG